MSGELSHGLAYDAINDVRKRFASQRHRRDFRCRFAQRSHGIGTRRGDVRRGDDVRQGTQRAIDGNRFGVADINRRPGQMPRLQRGNEGRGIDEVAPSQIDDQRSGLHPRDGSRIKQLLRLRRRRTMQSHDVGLGQEFVDRDRLASGCSDCVGGNERVMYEPPTLKRSQSRSHFTPNPPKADETDCLVAQRPQLIERSRQSPFAFAYMQRVRDNLPRDAEDECQLVIGDFIDAVVRDVADGNAPLACRLHVDIVVADAVPHDHFGALHRSNDIGVDRGELRDDRIGIGNQCLERQNLFVVPAPQLESAGGQDRLFDLKIGERVIGDHNRGHSVLAFAFSRIAPRLGSAT